MKIVMSATSFALITVFFVALFALPLVQGQNLYDLIGNFIEVIKSMSSGSGDPSAYITYMIIIMVITGATIGFGIRGIVQSIILLVQSIQGVSSKSSKAPMSTLVGFGLGMFLYVAVLCSFGTTIQLGVGAILMLVVGSMALTLAGVYHAGDSSNGRKVVNRILDLVTASLALVGMMLMLIGPVSYGDETVGVTSLFTAFINQMVHSGGGSSDDVFLLYIAMFGMALTFVAFGFVGKVIEYGFTLEQRQKKDVDYAKSSIIKSALWFGFTLLGFILIVVVYSRFGYKVGIPSILTLAFAMMTLAAAIVNKCLQGPVSSEKKEEPSQKAVLEEPKEE